LLDFKQGPHRPTPNNIVYNFILISSIPVHKIYKTGLKLVNSLKHERKLSEYG